MRATLLKAAAFACLLAAAGSAPATIHLHEAQETAGTAAVELQAGMPWAAAARYGSRAAGLRTHSPTMQAHLLPPALPEPVALAANTRGKAQPPDRSGVPVLAEVPAPGSAGRQPATMPAANRSGTAGPVATARATGPGQAGYVHFFVIEFPEGETETQIGIELDDGRIAWSFPESGVGVSPFIASGEIAVNGRVYAVQHLYGVRPFADDKSMAALRRELWERVIPWVEAETPYCNPVVRPAEFCLSCLGFALHVLYPGRTPAYPSLPPDFPRTASQLYYSTDDMLLYLTGMHALPDREARLARIDGLTLPQALRDDLVALVNSTEIVNRASAAAGAAPKTLSPKSRPGVRIYTRTPPQRKRL